MSKNVDASTSGTILATSRNKEKTSFPSPLLHIGERVQHSNQSSTTASHRRRGPLSTASHRRKSPHWTPRYGKPHTTFNSTKSSSSKANTSNMPYMRIYILSTKYSPSHHAWENKVSSTTHQLTNQHIQERTQPVRFIQIHA